MRIRIRTFYFRLGPYNKFQYIHYIQYTIKLIKHGQNNTSFNALNIDVKVKELTPKMALIISLRLDKTLLYKHKTACSKQAVCC